MEVCGGNAEREGKMVRDAARGTGRGQSGQGSLDPGKTVFVLSVVETSEGALRVDMV